MIVFDFHCLAANHRFEGWFASSADFAAQQERGLVCCPQCGSAEVTKAPTAAALGRKGNQLAVRTTAKPQPMTGGKLPPQAKEMMQTLAKMQAAALEGSRWVGDGFAEVSRAMHYGEQDRETIHGQATVAEAKDLHEEGIAVTPLPFPVVPPGEAN